MEHNSVVSGHPKSTGIPRVDGLSMGPLDLGCHNIINRYKAYKFDNIVTRISTTLVLQHIDDHNLISLTDQILFVCMNLPHKNKTFQQDDEQYYAVTSHRQTKRCNKTTTS